MRIVLSVTDLKDLLKDKFDIEHIQIVADDIIIKGKIKEQKKKEEKPSQKDSPNFHIDPGILETVRFMEGPALPPAMAPPPAIAPPSPANPNDIIFGTTPDFNVNFTTGGADANSTKK